MRGLLLHNTEFSPAFWDGFLGNCNGVSACAQYRWWGAVCPDWRAVVVVDDADNWLAVLPFNHFRKLYFLGVSAPPLWMPYTGPYIRQTSLTGYAKTQLLHQIWSCIIQTLPKTVFFQISIPPTTSWVNELKLAGFKIIPRLTYLADFQQQPTFPNRQHQLAHKLRQAEKQKFSLKKVETAEVEQLLNFSENQKKYSEKQVAVLKKLLETFPDQPPLGLYSADNKLITVNWSPVFANIRLNVLTLSNPSLQTGRATAGFLLQQQLQASRENQEIFDFEGSEIPGVENFYKRFGFDFITYFVATRYKYSTLLPKWI